MPEEKQKWTADNLPKGYPTECSRKDLSDAVKALTNEFTKRTTEDSKDFFNKGWSNRIVNFIQLGQNELQRRNNNIVLLVSIITLTVAIIALFKSSELCSVLKHFPRF